MADANPTSTTEGLDPSVVEAVSNGNFKNIGEMPAQLINWYAGNQVAHFNRVNILAETYLAIAVKNAHELSPKDAVSTLKEISGNDLAQQVSALGAAIASIQQSMKGAQTTLPETGQGK